MNLLSASPAMWLEWPDPKLVLSWALVYLCLCLSIIIIMVTMQQRTVTMAVITPMMIMTTSLSSLTITVWRAILLSAVLFSASLWVSANSVIAGPCKLKIFLKIQNLPSIKYKSQLINLNKIYKTSRIQQERKQDLFWLIWIGNLHLKLTIIWFHKYDF